MDFRRFLNLALAIFVTVGLAVAPLGAPAVAALTHADGMADMSMSAESMSADMPCCPGEQKNKNCQDCPLAAICVLKSVQAGPSETGAQPVRHAIRTAHSVLDDAPADGLDRPPPDHPPRNLV
jgi:hypothetical protein